MALHVTFWNEFRHEKSYQEVRDIYPEGLHAPVVAHLRTQGFETGVAALDEPEHGLSEATLANTDVLLWWGHLAHGEVQDAIVDRVQQLTDYARGVTVRVLAPTHRGTSRSSMSMSASALGTGSGVPVPARASWTVGWAGSLLAKARQPEEVAATVGAYGPITTLVNNDNLDDTSSFGRSFQNNIAAGCLDQIHTVDGDINEIGCVGFIIVLDPDVKLCGRRVVGRDVVVERRRGTRDLCRASVNSQGQC